MSVYKSVEPLLSDGETRSIDHMVAQLPKLSERAEGAEILRLLLRLNKKYKCMPNGHWVLASSAQTPEQRIVSATQAHFRFQDRPGELIGSLSKAVAAETGFSKSVVKSMILEKFENNQGKMVFNKLKETL